MLYGFFKNPDCAFRQNDSFSQSLKEFFSILGFTIFFLFVNYVAVSLVDLVIKFTTNFSFLEVINGAQKVASNQKTVLFFLVFAPVVEELVFRLPLKVSRKNLLISAVSAYILFYLSHKSLASILSANEALKFFGFVLVSFGAIFSLKEHRLRSFLNSYFSIYFYTLIIIFGLLHVTNFLDLIPKNLIAFAPLFAFHQVIVGFFLGYIRLKRGLIWCILLHFSLNLLPTIAYFLNK